MHAPRGIGLIGRRRASASHPSGSWDDHDFDVLDGEREVGRISRQVSGSWFWVVSFDITGWKSYGTAETVDAAMAAFKAAYERWQQEHGSSWPRPPPVMRSPPA